MILHPWSRAVESQLEAFKLSEYLIKHDDKSELRSGWQVDKILLTHATPYMWSKDVTAAVLEASKSIPLETELNRWNLQTEHSWWYFEQPLPFETLSQRQTTGVRAMAFGIFETKQTNKSFPPGTRLWQIERHLVQPRPTFGIPVVAWIDADIDIRFRLAPSQTFEWKDGQTLGTMLEESRRFHNELYGPGGRYQHQPKIGVEGFMAAAKGMARFMLAGLAWLRQSVVSNTEGHIERHRRKDIERTMNRRVDAVRVISLRKMEKKATEGEASQTEAEKRQYNYQWVVSGHWRHQVCGPKRGDRRLTYIFPYIKGPDDKPLKPQRPTVYTVDR